MLSWRHHRFGTSSRKMMKTKLLPSSLLLLAYSDVIALTTNRTMTQVAHMVKWKNERNEACCRFVPPEHRSDACQMSDRNQSNDFYIDQEMKGRRIPNDLIPEDNTIFCPEDEHSDRVALYEPSKSTGELKTRWIFQNDASEPVQVLWVDEDGREIQANGGKPSIVQPSKIAVIHTTMGHIFHIRTLGDRSTLLLRKTVGMIHVRNAKGARCDVMRQSHEHGSRGSPSYPRKKATDWSRHYTACNTIIRGFVNEVGCDVDVFVSTAHSASHRDNNSTCIKSAEACEYNRGMLGTEQPLALQTHNLDHLLIRMAHSHELVQEIRLDKTHVRDCPKHKKTKGAMVSEHSKEKVKKVEPTTMVITMDSLFQGSDIFHKQGHHSVKGNVSSAILRITGRSAI